MSLFRSRFDKASSAIMHSNAFADAADTAKPSFGSTSAETFSQRRAVDINRQHVDSFRGARVHNDYRMQELERRSQDGQDSAATHRDIVPPTRPTGTIASRPANTFREPTSRGFNPFH